MCQELHISDDLKIITKIETTQELIDHFGIKNVRFSCGSPITKNGNNDHCLCPVDLDFTLEKFGLDYVEYGHDLWSTFDTVVRPK